MVQLSPAEINIDMVTETQHKVEKIDFGKEYIYEVSMRGMEDKKGGGLLIGTYNDDVSMKRMNSGSPDILCVELEMRNTKMCVLLTYWDVREDERNETIVNCIKSWIDEYEGKLMVIGDMNAHVGF